MIPVRKLSDLDPLSRRAILMRPGIVTPDLLVAVQTIVSDVRDHGDDALRAYGEKFDKVKVDKLEVTPPEFEAAEAAVSFADRQILRTAFERVRRFHAEALPQSFQVEPEPGVKLGRRVTPYAKAGVYVPGGLAAYPTCVIMNAVPAAVAGVPEIILCTPPGPDGTINPAVLCTARIVGINRVFKTGGAQAIAAMAYGTGTIPRVEIVVGPGNRFVTAAKKIVSADVSIDFLAGPTELMIVSDGTGTPAFIAADLIAQAEHDPAACALLVTTSPAQAEAVAAEITKQVELRARREIIQTALTRHGAILLASDLREATDFANDFGPEHISIFCKEPLGVFASIRHAGAAFLGEFSPVAAGDYCAGPNSTLPTLGEARRTSGLSAATFLKSITYEQLTSEALARLAPMAEALAALESLEGHAASIRIRRERHGH